MRFAILFQLVLLLFCVRVSAQNPRLSFQHITIEDGLSNSTVQSFCKDSRGFIWIGTRDGLNRYDGNRITVFRNEIQNSASISENVINDIYEDKQQNLWIATAEGLDLFIPATETFVHFTPQNTPADVKDICEDRQGKLWLATSKGLYCFDKKVRKFVKWQVPGNAGKLSTERVNKLLQDKNGLLWAGTEKGLYRLDLKNRRSTYFGPHKGDARALQSPIIHELLQDSQARLWIGMSEGGLALFNPANETFKTYKASPDFSINPKANSLPHNDIHCVTEGEKGVLWVGTENGGLCVFDTNTGRFSTYRPVDTDPTSLSHDSVHGIYKDNQDNIWIGTWAGGVNLYSPTLLKFPLYNRFPQASFPGVESIMRDSNGLIWLGVVENGLYSFDPATKKFSYYPNPNISRFEVGVYSIKELNKDTLVLAVRRGGMAFFDKRSHQFTHYLPKAGDRNSIAGHELNTVLVDNKKNVWSGGWNTGLSRFNYASKTFSNYRHNPADKNSLSSDLIYTVYEDSFRNIWIGTEGGGLELYNPAKNNFTHFINRKGNLKSISHNTVFSIFEDSKGRFWVGTSNGLNLMDRKNSAFKVFTQKNGLPNDVVKSIIEDDKGNLWLGTNRGLCCFNPANSEVKNFGIKDGLQANEFLMNACARDLNGNLYFSGYKGLNIFHPSQLKYNTFVPPAVITDFSISNKSVVIGAEDSPLSRHISQTKELVLSYKESVFSFDFAALNFTSPEKNQYAYRMEGFEKTWNYVGAKHTATYTNLDPGTYTFRVIASNNDGVWNNKGTSLKIVITPPFWDTWWFRLFTIALILFIAYKLLSYRRQQELKALEERKREEMQQVQLQFFTNISHEFRTPLSLIIGPLEKLLSENTGSAFRNYYQVMFRNANRLMNLINELMDFRKIESGALRLKVNAGNLTAFVKEIADDFTVQAEERNISYRIEIREETEVWFDSQVLEKIILNLINNSFKYTPDGGKVTVEVFDKMDSFTPHFENTLILKSDYKTRNYVYFRIEDTGIGISKDSIQHLFQRYYRIADAHLGSGVGLAFVKSLTFLHKGQIFVSSEKHKGTEIIIAIPSEKADYSSNERRTAGTDEAHIKLESLQYRSETEGFSKDISDSIATTGNEKSSISKHILIVDDNEELRAFLRDSLKDLYEISEAANGREGIEKAKEVSPDLIISDVMMPDMDGIEFCRRVKEDLEISHIPFLMLTAKNTLESEIEGVESGADFYFSKPISINLLNLTLRNIFQQKSKLIERYTKDHHAEVKELVHSTKDKEFMDKLLAIIESQLINPDLDIELLCSEIGMSRTSLYQKIKSITGLPIGEFIRKIRLRKAMEIMTHEDVALSEVIFRVGIQTQSYFTKAFKKEFGKTPSQYLQEIEGK